MKPEMIEKLKEIATRSRLKADQAKENNAFSTMEYFLGRAHGIEIALQIALDI